MTWKTLTSDICNGWKLTQWSRCCVKVLLKPILNSIFFSFCFKLDFSVCAHTFGDSFIGVSWKHFQCKTFLNYLFKKNVRKEVLCQVSICLCFVFKRCSTMKFLFLYLPPVSTPQWTAAVINLYLRAFVWHYPKQVKYVLITMETVIFPLLCQLYEF